MDSADAGLLTDIRPSWHPDAEPDDGVLDVTILTPRRWFQWVGLAANVVVGRRPQPWQLQRRRAAETVIRRPAQVPAEIDGHLSAPAGVLTFTMSARALDVGRYLAAGARTA